MTYNSHFILACYSTLPLRPEVRLWSVLPNRFYFYFHWFCNILHIYICLYVRLQCASKGPHTSTTSWIITDWFYVRHRFRGSRNERKIFTIDLPTANPVLSPSCSSLWDDKPWRRAVCPFVFSNRMTCPASWSRDFLLQNLATDAGDCRVLTCVFFPVSPIPMSHFLVCVSSQYDRLISVSGH